MHPNSLFLVLDCDVREDRRQEQLNQLGRHQFEELLLCMAIREKDGQEREL